MKQIFALFIFLLILTNVEAQSIERQVIGGAGTTISDGNVTVGFTVGELVITNITDGTTTLAQGFHQATVSLGITINPTVFLQGAILNPNTGEESLMRDDLRENYVPLTSPYTDVLTCESTVFQDGGTSTTGVTEDNIVDWIWVELRDATDNTLVKSGQSALLQRDGDIVGVDGLSNLEFPVAAKSYYVAIKHRNHLSIITAATVSLSDVTTVLDLSSDSSLINGDFNAVAEVSTGLFAMLGGDYDENTQVQNSDISSVTLELGSSGYSNADMDMNGQIQNTDINNLMNPNIGKGEQF